MPLAAFELVIPASGRLQTRVLDRVVTVNGALVRVPTFSVSHTCLWAVS